MREVKRPETVIKNYSPVAVRCEGAPGDGYSVLVKDRKSQFQAWFDVWVDIKYKDIREDWNQFIFSTLDSRDMFNKQVMEDCDVFDLTSSVAVEYLLVKGLLVQDKHANWSYGEIAERR